MIALPSNPPTCSWHVGHRKTSRTEVEEHNERSPAEPQPRPNPGGRRHGAERTRHPGRRECRVCSAPCRRPPRFGRGWGLTLLLSPCSSTPVPPCYSVSRHVRSMLAGSRAGLSPHQRLAVDASIRFGIEGVALLPRTPAKNRRDRLVGDFWIDGISPVLKQINKKSRPRPGVWRWTADSKRFVMARKRSAYRSHWLPRLPPA